MATPLTDKVKPLVEAMEKQEAEEAEELRAMLKARGQNSLEAPLLLASLGSMLDDLQGLLS